MKADLPQREPQILKQWDDEDIYGLIRAANAGKPKYVLHDGPPYANGDIHIGHAFNKTLKDIIIKFKTMQGFDSPYVPGWDCHGLPVEHALFKELKIHKSQIGQVEFRAKAHDYALKFVELQKGEFKRLGVFGDWEHPYLTLDRSYEESIVRSFGELAARGFIYRGLKPVNWCYRCEPALAEAEVEYEEHTSPSVFVKFRLEPKDGFAPDSFLVIWTTTPWTLIANVAAAVHPDFTYSYIKTAKGNLVIANVRLQVLPLFGIEKYELIREFKGRELEGLAYTHPFGLRTGKVVLADYVSGEEGTGLVHTAPGHGNEDYLTGMKYGLEIIMPVDSRGKFDKSAGEFAGMNVHEANDAIMQKLQGQGDLLYSDKISHSYPHCWRCKNPIIFRATNQWFLKIDRKDERGGAFRHYLLGAIASKVEWVPPAGSERISAMVSTRPDWCLSRQRYWGVPIPSLICKKCGEEKLFPEVIERFRELTAQEGTDCWFARDVPDFTGGKLACSCGSKEFAKGQDILDVWFDSGASNQAVLKTRKGLVYPAQLYLEGSDQHRGWFQASLIVSMGIDSKPPFQTVLTHGFVVDDQGKKMSKSAWNGLSPAIIEKEFGADILRLWVTSSDYNEDIRCSKQIFMRLAEGYRKIRNTARFMLSNLYDFNPDDDTIEYDKLKRIDTWILWRIESVKSLVTSAYEHFEFNKAYKALYDFCNEDLSMYYLDMAKGRLYTAGARSPERRACQTALYQALNALVRMAAPILAFTAEEIWQHMPKRAADRAVKSIHLAPWPAPDPRSAQAGRETDIEEELGPAIELMPGVTKALEEKRSSGMIGSSFDAKIIMLTNNEKRYTYLTSLGADLTEIFKVSRVEAVRKEVLDVGSEVNANYPDIRIVVEKAGGAKCSRCWNFSESVGKADAHPELCAKCVEAINPS
jgi:isoleucyl-tRNA synthetase